MSSKDFVGVYAPSATPHTYPRAFLTSAVKDMFTLPQLLLPGAISQIALFALLPSRYALLPAFLFLFYSVGAALFQASSPARNPFLQGAIYGKTSAQLPNSSYHPEAADGRPLFGSVAAARPVVVLHLGVRINHPLGPLAPGAKETGDHFLACVDELSRRAGDFGCTGMSTWRGSDRSSNNTVLAIFYFRSLEGLHTFAHDKTHREAWDWMTHFNRETGHRHVGVFHETFVAAPGGYETIYLNTPPVLMGATNARVRNEKTGEDEFHVPLVNADVSGLRSQYGRMDRTPSGEPKVA